VWRDFRSLLRCDLGILVRGTVAGSECPTLVKVMPDVDVLLTEIARAKRLAAAMIDTALRKRFESVVAEFQRELDTVDQRPVSQRSPEKN
jgi:hypothetical protein